MAEWKEGGRVATPLLQGRRVRLEPMRWEHKDALAEVAMDERIWRYMTQWVRTRADLESWMTAALEVQERGSAMVWATVLQESGRVVGSTRFLDLDRRHKTVELGHTWISPELHGSGLNTECKLLQLKYGFEELGLNRIAFKTHHENLRSQAAIRKLGAVEEGTFRNHYVMPDGSLRHSVWYSITREEWPGVRSKLEERLRST